MRSVITEIVEGGPTLKIDIQKLDLALDGAIEAAIDGSLWHGVVEDIARATGSYGANIIPVTERSPGLIIASDSLGGVFDDYFSDGWHENDLRLRALPLLLRDGTACDPQYTSRDEFEQHAYYRFLAKHGIGRSCMIGFSMPSDMLVLTLNRKLEQDFFDEEEVAVLGTMRDRLMMSSAIMRAASRQKTAGMAEAFEMAGLAAVFFDRFCKVTTVNGPAERLLGSDLQVSERELRSSRRNETRLIEERMRAVLSEDWLGRGAAHGPIFIERPGLRPLVLRLQRLGGNFPDVFAHSVGVCLVEDSEAVARSEPQLLRQMFGLTPTEAEILVLLGRGMRLRDIAEVKSIAYETARSHLRSIFTKTETGRQAELVALVANIRARC